MFIRTFLSQRPNMIIICNNVRKSQIILHIHPLRRLPARAPFNNALFVSVNRWQRSPCDVTLFNVSTRTCL